MANEKLMDEINDCIANAAGHGQIIGACQVMLEDYLYAQGYISDDTDKDTSPTELKAIVPMLKKLRGDNEKLMEALKNILFTYISENRPN